MSARLVTVHLLIADQNPNEPQTQYTRAADIADGVSALLGDAEASGFLLDWGYANGAAAQMGVTYYHLSEGLANRRQLSAEIQEKFAAFIGQPVRKVFPPKRSEVAA